MIHKFPFGDTLMKDLSVLQPESTSSFAISKILTLAKRFPLIAFADSASLDCLKEQFEDFKLSPDLPSLEYRAADGVMRPKADLFWSEVGKMTTLDGKPRFDLLVSFLFLHPT